MSIKSKVYAVKILLFIIYWEDKVMEGHLLSSFRFALYAEEYYLLYWVMEKNGRREC